MAPLLASATIGQISPVNTLDTLTRGVSHRAAPKRVWPTYFRVNSRDAFQGLFGADYAYTQAGFRTVVVIHDTEPYGRDLAKDFARRFQSKGGKVVGTLTVRQGATDFQTEANKVVDLNPDMVFYGGEYPEGGPLTRQLKARGFKGAVMGGDGLYAADFFKGADDKGEGTLVTVAGEPVERLDTASQFVNDYEAVGFKEGYGAYGAQSFDTANILIQVLAKALPNAENVDAARPQIVKAVGETNGFKGVTGEISFDEYGDIVNQAFTVYRAKGSDWLPVFSGKFEP